MTTSREGFANWLSRSSDGDYSVTTSKIAGPAELVPQMLQTAEIEWEGDMREEERERGEAARRALDADVKAVAEVRL